MDASRRVRAETLYMQQAPRWPLIALTVFLLRRRRTDTTVADNRRRKARSRAHRSKRTLWRSRLRVQSPAVENFRVHTRALAGENAVDQQSHLYNSRRDNGGEDIRAGRRFHAHRPTRPRGIR